MAFRVFISYSTLDVKMVRKVDSLIKGIGAEVFFAERSIQPGQALSTEIRNAIRNTNLFILLWSKNAEASSWVPDEVGQANAHKKPILPVLLDQDATMPPTLRDLKYLDASDNAESALVKLRDSVFARIESKADSDKQTAFWLVLGLGLLLTGGK